MKLDLNDIANTGMEQYKTILKKKVREATLKHLKKPLKNNRYKV